MTALRGRHIGSFVIVALALHAAGAWLLLRTEPNSGARAPGEAGLVIGLGAAGGAPGVAVEGVADVAQTLGTEEATPRTEAVEDAPLLDAPAVTATTVVEAARPAPPDATVAASSQMEAVRDSAEAARPVPPAGARVPKVALALTVADPVPASLPEATPPTVAALAPSVAPSQSEIAALLPPSASAAQPRAAPSLPMPQQATALAPAPPPDIATATPLPSPAPASSPAAATAAPIATAATIAEAVAPASVSEAAVVRAPAPSQRPERSRAPAALAARPATPATAQDATSRAAPAKSQTGSASPASPAPATTAAGDAGGAGAGATQASGSGDASPGGGNPGARQDFSALVTATLARHKRYPPAARARRQEGTGVLVFVMDASGRVLRVEFRRSAGHAVLDAEILDLLRRAEPLPRIPPELGLARMEFTVPVAFALR